MVSALLHSACLRMEATGTGVNEVLTPRGIHRWLGRGGLAVGGAASLAVGAILGGALETIPILLPPQAAAAQGSGPVVEGLSGFAPVLLAANSLPGYEVLPAPAPIPSASSAPLTAPCGTCSLGPVTGGPIHQNPVQDPTKQGGTTVVTPPDTTQPTPVDQLANTLQGVVTQVATAVPQLQPVATVLNSAVGSAASAADQALSNSPISSALP